VRCFVVLQRIKQECYGEVIDQILHPYFVPDWIEAQKPINVVRLFFGSAFNILLLFHDQARKDHRGRCGADAARLRQFDLAVLND